MKRILFYTMLLCQTYAFADTLAEQFVYALSADDTKGARKAFNAMPDEQRLVALQTMFDEVEVASYAQEVKNFLARFLANPINVAPSFWKQLKVTHKWKQWIETQHKLKQVARPLHVKHASHAKKEKAEKHMGAQPAAAAPSQEQNQLMGAFEVALKNNNLDTAFEILNVLNTNDTAPYIFKLVKQRWNALSRGEAGQRIQALRHFIRLSDKSRAALLNTMKLDSTFPQEAVIFFEGKAQAPPAYPEKKHQNQK
jgi:hypothetical protein